MAVSEDRFGKMTTNEKLWEIFDSTQSLSKIIRARDYVYKKHFKRLYVGIGILVVSVIGGEEAVAKAAELIKLIL